jgi:putative transposase
MKAGRYYVSVVVEVPDPVLNGKYGEGLGIDLGLKDLATISNGDHYKNINKTPRVRKIEKKLRREQRCLSRKYENIKKGEASQRKNIQKQKLKVQKLYQRLDHIRTDHINKTIDQVVRTKPSYIVIEDLNVSGMMKNRHLSKAIASQKLREFRDKLEKKCSVRGIEMRIADRWYPSSKRCHCCGRIREDLRLSERTYRCECGYHCDRDLNASLNLRDTEEYRLV